MHGAAAAHDGAIVWLRGWRWLQRGGRRWRHCAASVATAPSHGGAEAAAAQGFKGGGGCGMQREVGGGTWQSGGCYAWREGGAPFDPIDSLFHCKHLTFCQICQTEIKSVNFIFNVKDISNLLQNVKRSNIYMF